MGRVRAICLSKKRGTAKTSVDKAIFKVGYGIEGDAHAGKWHRQVSLLAAEKFDAFRASGVDVEAGAFGENLLVEGIDFGALPVATQLRAGKVLLEMTQIGKDCHSHCAIYHQVGDCIMPREGVFATVLEGGTISVGQMMSVIWPADKRPFTVAVVTVSDKGAAGSREDESGPAVRTRLAKNGYQVVETLLVPDGMEPLASQLIRLCDQRQIDCIFTSGGTGFSPRDRTPEATKSVADRDAPGIAEAIRLHSLRITPYAMFSRGLAVIRGKTLIINLPGSPKAVTESLDAFLDFLPHALDVLRGTSGDCAILHQPPTK